jgi:predicted MFS family arabinose efflux permease
MQRWQPTAAMFFVNGATFGVWSTQILLAKDRLDLDPMVLGRLLLLVGLGAVIAMAASGWIMQRLGSSRLIRMSGVVFLILLPLVCTAPSPMLLGLALFFFGASGGSMDVAMNAHGADAEQRFARHYMSSFHGMWSVGGLVGATIGSVLLTLVGGAAQSLIMAGLLALVFLWGQIGLLPLRKAAAAGAHASLKPTPIALLIGALTALCFASEGAVLDWGSIYLNEQLGALAALAGSGYAAFSGAMSVGRFGGDFLRKRYGGVAITRAGFGLAVIGLLAGPLTGSPVLAVIGFGAAGLGLSNIVPVLISAAGATRNPESAIAVVTTLGYAGLLLAPPVLGFVAHFSSLAMIFIVTALACLVIALGAFVLAPAAAGREGRHGEPAGEASAG